MSVPLATRIRDSLCVLGQIMRRQYLIKVWHMEIGEGCRISSTAKLDKTYPQGIHIGKYTAITFGSTILTHDWINCVNRDVYVGDQCFIGAHSIILPGVRIGDNCIVAAGALVARNVPPNSLVAGNPARVVESNLELTRWGIRVRSQAHVARKQPHPQEVTAFPQ